MQPIAELVGVVEEALPRLTVSSVESESVEPESSAMHSGQEDQVEDPFFATLEEFAVSLLLATQNLHRLWNTAPGVDTNQPGGHAEDGVQCLEDESAADEDAGTDDMHADEDSDFDEGLLTVKSIQGIQKAVQCVNLSKVSPRLFSEFKSTWHGVLASRIL